MLTSPQGQKQNPPKAVQKVPPSESHKDLWLRSSSLKKPPEPLRRVVAESLSSSSLAAVAEGVSSHHQGGP
ncbi:hypothetical protein ERO13_D06G132150v2 [Gossypium hirsutum]|uniref:Uncharacterized protein n=3 Tax=Gossypium TaxID=3633 RepID=A0A0D2VAS2_GOSRA|nr:hypothetical protein ES319_D06G153800v1 [Gossypium barbadense]KAG4142477.1 hypothetical protein ERO13_D06G132150v2 [Gossypium hirsutum]KJB66720.1 hypothetical protein B456_010G154000 [Gossypium raimondii]TYI77652.1 hypothetical protein E1A91_D06G156400v1 [Gossypium mustelinum]